MILSGSARDGLDVKMIFDHSPTTIHTMSDVSSFTTYETESGNSRYNINKTEFTQLDQIVKTFDNKHLIILRHPTWPYNNNNDFNALTQSSFKSIMDFGYIYDGNILEGLCLDMGHPGSIANNTSYTTDGGFCEYHGGIVTATVLGELWWSPIDTWLPHKVTGTTTTIQSYNNPKKITSTKAISLYFTNNPEIVTPPTT